MMARRRDTMQRLILSSAHPQHPFKRTRTFTMPYGKAEEGELHHIGSLDLLAAERPRALFDTGVVELHGAEAGSN